MVWDGAAAVEGNRILEVKPINFLHPEKRLEREDDARLRWRSLTTGNLAGFDLWLEEAGSGRLRLETPLLRTDLPIGEIGPEDTCFELGGLDRRLRVVRLPESNPHRSLEFERRLELKPAGDNAIYVRLTLEDGHQAWSSPIYIWRA